MKIFPKHKIKNSTLFFKKYTQIHAEFLLKLDYDLLNKISLLLERTIKKNKNIFVCGNGGSAAIANHFLCDFNKGIKISSKKKMIPKVISLNSSNEIITAIANDISFSSVFSQQLENYANKGDCLLTISCSGNSRNIIEAIKISKKKQLNIISFTGFEKTNKFKTKIHFNVGCKNYGICEDIFQGLMHMISQSIRQKFSIKKL